MRLRRSTLTQRHVITALEIRPTEDIEQQTKDVADVVPRYEQLLPR
jgi:hypothetical protein